MEKAEARAHGIQRSCEARSALGLTRVYGYYTNNGESNEEHKNEMETGTI